METRYIGKLIQCERMKSGLSASAVYKGLCDLNIYDKIEKGKYTGDIHLIRLVLQRLGISASIAGKYLCRDEYDEMLSRFNILEFIKEGRLDKANSALQEYRKSYSVYSVFNIQFSEYVQARVEELHGNMEESLKLYKNAASYTIMNYENETFTCLSLYEYFILANIARLMAYTGNREVAEQLYEKLLLYCKGKKQERWIITCIYPKTVCEMLNLNLPQNMGHYNARIWLEECEASLKVLRDTSRLHFISPLLKNRKILLGSLGETVDERWDYFIKYYEWLRKIYKMEGELFEWYPYYIDYEFYPVEKVIDERRKLCGISIENLADEVCTPETVSRIINRRVSPKYSTVDALLCKLGLRGILSECIVVAEDMEVHEIWDEIVQCQSVGDYDTERKLYNRLINRLDMTIPINEKVAQYKNIEFDINHNKNNYETFASLYEKSLGFDIEKVKKLTIFTDVEVMIINKYFYCEDKAKHYERLSVYQTMCNSYLSMGDMRKAFASQFEGTLARCASYKGNAEEYAQSDSYSDMGIKLELECERTHSLPSLIYCIPWNSVHGGKGVSERDVNLCESAYWIAWFNRENQRMKLYRHWLEQNSLT